MKIEEAKHLLRNSRVAIYLDVDDLSLIKTILKETFPEEGEKDSNVLKLGQYVRRYFGSWDAFEKPPFGYVVVKLSEIEMEEKIDKWCIKNTHKYIGEWFNKNRTYEGNTSYVEKEYTDLYLHYPHYIGQDGTRYHSSEKIEEEYKEVDLKWFQENILNMKKYTIDECFNNKIAIWCNNKEEGVALVKAINPDVTSPFMGGVKDGFEVFITSRNSISEHLHSNIDWQDKYNKNYFTSRTDLYKATKCIDFNEIDFDMKENKQIGWIVKPEYLPTVERILGFKLNENPYGHFGIKSIVEEDLANLKILDLFCTPLYKEEKSPVILNIGSQKIEISDVIKVGNVNVNISSLEGIISYYDLVYKDVSKLNDWIVQFALTEEQKVIKVGCSIFSLKELKQVIEEFNKWNKK